MQSFTGKCRGGPLDGQMLAHTSKRYALVRPMVNGLSMNIEREPIEIIEIGTYRLNDFGQWHWWETKEGRALKTLDERN